jgi:formylglycine-generating enzyme required for sulfatase activity
MSLLSLFHSKKDEGEDQFGITWILVQGLEHQFYISATLVTFELYDRFCEATGYEKPRDYFGRGKQPVSNVTIADAVAFCEWLGKETGTTVRLPEPIEWEFAESGGMKNKGFIYSGSNTMEEVGWYSENSGGAPHPVGLKKANELGIFDMSGNVWEWCGTAGAIRGGSWRSSLISCRVSLRDGYSPVTSDSDYGFRIVQLR